MLGCIVTPTNQTCTALPYVLHFVRFMESYECVVISVKLWIIGSSIKSQRSMDKGHPFTPCGFVNTHGLNASYAVWVTLSVLAATSKRNLCSVRGSHSARRSRPAADSARSIVSTYSTVVEVHDIFRGELRKLLRYRGIGMAAVRCG